MELDEEYLQSSIVVVGSGNGSGSGGNNGVNGNDGNDYRRS